MPKGGQVAPNDYFLFSGVHAGEWKVKKHAETNYVGLYLHDLLWCINEKDFWIVLILFLLF